MKILSCNSNIHLAESISETLNTKLVRAEVKRFSDMEVFVEVQENVRGEDMFVIQSTSYPANDNLMELLVSLDALRRASARRSTSAAAVRGAYSTCFVLCAAHIPTLRCRGAPNTPMIITAFWPVPVSVAALSLCNSCSCRQCDNNDSSDSDKY